MPDLTGQMPDLTGLSLGPYAITERIGSGGMAEVYKALHRDLQVHRAVKVIRPELSTAADFRARFQKEARAVAQLRHPNIVQVHDFGMHGNAYYMVMEFIEGRNLKQIVAAEGPIRPIPRAVDLTDRIASALEYAHGRGIIHRDIKPENVMVTAAGEPILTDFGIAKLATASTKLTQTGFGIGTPAYMAPEQALGQAEIGPQADIYALTIVLFELLTRCQPFSADTPIGVMMKSINDPLPLPRDLNDDISELLQSVIIRGAQKRPEDRFATAAEFRRALAAAINARGALEETLAAATPARSASTSPGSVPRRRRAALPVAIGAAAIVAGGAAWFLRPDAPPAAGEPVDAEQPAAEIEPRPAEAGTAVPNDIAGTQLASQTPIAPPLRSQGANPSEGNGGRKPPADLKDGPPAKVTPAFQTRSAASPADETAAPTTKPAAEPLAPPPPAATGTQVVKGVTTQRDLLRLFGGPNLTTVDEAGRETWIYERTFSQTDSSTSSQSVSGSADFNVFFNVIQGGARTSAGRTNDAASTRSTVRSVTVIVTFAPDRTVFDYTVRESYF